MRPVAEYWFQLRYTKPDFQVIELYASGETPCRARNAMFMQLEQAIKQNQQPPNPGWVLVSQQPAQWHPRKQ